MKKIAMLMVLSVMTLSSMCQDKYPELNYEKLDQLITFCDTVTRATEVMVIHKDRVVGTLKDRGCDSVYMNTSSMIKSWTGLVVGILVDRKIIDSVDILVSKYIPGWKAGAANGITVKHLLTMTAGMNRRSGARGILAVQDMRSYLLAFEPDTLPGIRFGYSNESVQYLGMVIESATGKTANEVFREYLFDPLEMDSSSLVSDAAGNDIVFGGARTTLQDAAKIGQLMLHRGRYNEIQVVPEAWIDASLVPGKLAPYYGYLWWLDNVSANRNYAATGDGGQFTIIFPDLDLVFLRRQQCHQEKTGNMPWMGPGFIQMIASIIEQ